MPSKAILRNIGYSSKKTRQLIDVIRGMEVEKALQYLDFSPRRAARDVAKLLRSAIANADKKGDMDLDILYVSKAVVDVGPITKRGQARARGRYFEIRKPSCHVTIELDERTKSKS